MGVSSPTGKKRRKQFGLEKKCDLRCFMVIGSLKQVIASSLHLLRNTMFSLLYRRAQIDLSDNRLCGIWFEWLEQKGTYSTEGIKAIADAAFARGSLTVK